MRIVSGLVFQERPAVGEAEAHALLDGFGPFGRHPIRGTDGALEVFCWPAASGRTRMTAGANA